MKLSLVVACFSKITVSFTCGENRSTPCALNTLTFMSSWVASSLTNSVLSLAVRYFLLNDEAYWPV